MSDWFRQINWNKEIEAYFFKKLARARRESRAQYLKIQALELIKTQNLTVLFVAEKLIQKLLSDYPENDIDRAQCFLSLGDISSLQGDSYSSLMYYRLAIVHEEIYPNVITNAYLDFAEIVIKLKKEEFYSLVQSLVLNRVKNSLFPIEKYMSYSFLSIIDFRKGNYIDGCRFSALAEHYASAKTTDLRYHRYLGIVSKREQWIEGLIASYKAEMDEKIT